MIETAIRAAKEAEKIIMNYYQQTLAEERKADHPLVTVADKEAEKKLREVILADFPDHEILGEEAGAIGEKGSIERLAKRDRTLARLGKLLEEYRRQPATFACTLVPRRAPGAPRTGCA